MSRMEQERDKGVEGAGEGGLMIVRELLPGTQGGERDGVKGSGQRQDRGVEVPSYSLDKCRQIQEQYQGLNPGALQGLGTEQREGARGGAACVAGDEPGECSVIPLILTAILSSRC